jgi:hypothetical protein
MQRKAQDAGTIPPIASTDWFSCGQMDPDGMIWRDVSTAAMPGHNRYGADDYLNDFQDVTVDH